MSHIEQSDGFPAPVAPAGQTGESTGAARWRTDWDSKIEPVSGNGWVNAVASTVLDGRAVAVTAGGDGTARVWDLAAGEQIGQMLELYRGPVNAVAATVLNGRPVAVTAGDDGTARLWDLATCEQIGDHLVSAYSDVWAVATAVPDGRPVAVTSEAEGPLQVIDLADGRPLGELTGHDGPVPAVATTVLDGRPIAVTAGADDTMRVWDLTTCEQLCSRPTTEPSAMSAGLEDGRPVAVTLAQAVLADAPRHDITDHVLRVWDLTGREPAGQVVDGPWSSGAQALTPRGRLLVSSCAGLAALTHH
ncbi:hypothetical protein ABT224_10635 [Streptomyces sp. NPDC001584]|uniref:WD40 repeat domain-containing protein n=1 Tax=Streptomyces sp. NPDC001584 TaxID=3154521 RepID=UPI0033255C2F